MRMIEAATDRCSRAVWPMLEPNDLVRAQAKMQKHVSQKLHRALTMQLGPGSEVKY